MVWVAQCNGQATGWTTGNRFRAGARTSGTAIASDTFWVHSSSCLVARVILSHPGRRQNRLWIVKGKATQQVTLPTCWRRIPLVHAFHSEWRKRLRMTWKPSGGVDGFWPGLEHQVHSECVRRGTNRENVPSDCMADYRYPCYASSHLLDIRCMIPGGSEISSWEVVADGGKGILRNRRNHSHGLASNWVHAGRCRKFLFFLIAFLPGFISCVLAKLRKVT